MSGKVYNAFTGHKVRLRSVRPDDFDAFMNDGLDSDVARRCDEIHLPTHPEHLKARLAAPPKPGDAHRWLAIERVDTAELVGSMTVKHQMPGTHHASYGIAVFRDHWSNGFASEAIALLLRYQFREQRTHYVYATVWSFNEPSLALHRALGFSEEGRLREIGFSAGEYFDEVHFGMLAREFIGSELEARLPKDPPL